MRNVLLTGATGKVGLKFLKCLINEEHKVTIVVRDIVEAKNKIIDYGISLNNIKFIVTDLTSSDTVGEIIKNLEYNIDAVVFNARSVKNLVISELGTITSKQFQDEFYMAVTLPYMLITSLLNHSQLKDIIFISSIYGVVVPNKNLYTNYKFESPVNYGVCKSAQIHLTKEFAVRFAELGIRTNCISFGGIDGRVDENFKTRYSNLTPYGGMLNLEDLYPPLKYILDNPHLPITGENLKIDGGWTLW